MASSLGTGTAGRTSSTRPSVFHRSGVSRKLSILLEALDGRADKK